MANDVRARASLKDDLSGPLTRIGDAWNKQAKSFTAGALAAKGVEMGFSLAGRAIGAVTDFLGDATKAFMDDERSQAQLRTSLRANITAWDGNTAAIEKVLRKRTELGFADDEQRDSLRKLVGAYGDVNKALSVQRTAMDLARFSGVDLATASDVLVKVHAGNYRALKALGIQTSDVTDETSALAAIQKVATGQAEAYAQTISGKVLTAQTKLADKQEEFGRGLAELTGNLATTVVDTLDWAEALREADRLMPGLTHGTNEQRDAVMSLARSLLEGTDEVEDHGDALIGVRLAAEKLPGPLDESTDSVHDLTDAERQVIAKTTRVAETLERVAGISDKLPAKLDLVTDALFGGAQRTGELADAQRDLADLQDEKPPNRQSKEYQIWLGEIAAAKQRIFELQFQMAQEEGPAALDTWLRKQRDKLGQADQKGRDYLNTLIALNSLALGPAAKAALTTIDFGQYEGKIIPGYHEGGRPTPGEPAIVGEKGPELFVPDTAGTVIPAGSWGTGTGGASRSPVVINVTLDGAVLARVVDRRLRYASPRSASLPD